MTKWHWADLWKKLLTKWTLYRFLIPTFIGLLLSLVFYAVGLNCSNPQDSLPLARSGSAATATFILLGLYNYEKFVSESQTRAEDYFASMVKGFSLTGEASLERLKQEAAENTKFITRLILILNTLGLAAATLVWGFGDLAKNWL